jgi:hypothetical protein
MSIVGILWRVRGRLMHAVEETVFANWQLGLLGTTGIVLSLASGYTTWDGMRNFTGEPVLSGMITFGIQGVMLLPSWVVWHSEGGHETQVNASASPITVVGPPSP